LLIIEKVRKLYQEIRLFFRGVKMKKLFFNLLMMSLICFAALLVGCSKKGAESPPKKTKLAFITNGASDFWAFTRKGCEKADD